MSGSRQVAFIGLGGMGAGMASRLLASGFPLVVHNRTAARTAPLAAAGARAAASAAEAASLADVLILSLSDEAAVEQVLFGEAAGKLAPGALVVDTSTVSPAYSAAAAGRLEQAGARRVEACVLGNPAMAQAGKLRIFTAGRRGDVGEADDLLGALAQQVQYAGPAGSACALKLAFNLVLGSQVAALAEAAWLVEGAGLDRDAFLTAIAASGFASPVLAFRAELMRGRRYEPAAFRATLMEKDLRLALAEAAAHGIGLPVTAQAAAQFAATVAAGGGDQDAAVVAELVKTLASAAQG